MPNIEPFETYAGDYEAWFERNPWAYQSELEAVRSQLPASGLGVEIGVGSGRFAGPLGIRVGVDPSASMRALAERRGINVLDAQAEKLPFENFSFDYALMVTAICFLDDVPAAFREAFRILKPEGALIVGFVDRDSSLGGEYQKKKTASRFYSSARFYCVDDVIRMVQEAGFRRLHCVQTLFGDIRQMDRIDPVKEGKGQGAFVVTKAEK
jgi:ubiquinone/menaquinone biosynthesis C-methylase UbiE